ncbi:MAG TPA: thioredoxin domain-containing protein [Solirubrobacterales bacterium]|nr:thioredoxin domain-containing protein [Solirubrobacterales bacterium]
MPAEGARRQRLLRLAAGALFLATAAVVVLVVVNSSGSAGGDAQHITGAREINRELKGIPQYGLILGDEEAPVELIEYGDLQCPVCKGYAEEILPPIIQTAVRSGKVKISFRNFTIIGPESGPAGTAALAAGYESLGWNYLEIFYRNQGEENSGYADEDFLAAVAKAAGVKDMAKWKESLKTLAFEPEVTTEQAKKLGFTGTPSFAITGPGTDGVEKLGTPGSTGAFEEAIANAE